MISCATHQHPRALYGQRMCECKPCQTYAGADISAPAAFSRAAIRGRADDVVQIEFRRRGVQIEFRRRGVITDSGCSSLPSLPNCFVAAAGFFAAFRNSFQKCSMPFISFTDRPVDVLTMPRTQCLGYLFRRQVETRRRTRRRRTRRRIFQTLQFEFVSTLEA